MKMSELKVGDLVQTPKFRERVIIREDIAKIIMMKKFTIQVMYMSGKKFGKTEVWSINEAKKLNTIQW